MVVTVSDRAAGGVYADASGPAAQLMFQEAGHTCEVVVVPDDPAQLTHAIQAAVDGGASVVLTTGGTGLGPRDLTPQTVEPMLDHVVPGLVEEIRRRSVVRIPTAMLSRAVAGVLRRGDHRCFVLTAPGSVGGVRDSVTVLLEVLDHILDQLGGSDHPRDDASGSVPRPRPVPRAPA